MDSPHAFTNQLDFLTDALENPGTDLHTVLLVLMDDLTTAIPSLLGLNLTITVAGDIVTLTTTVSPEPPVAAASLRVPLDRLTAVGAGSAVTFYAGRPGAFVDLAADIRYAYGLDGQVVVDGHLPTSVLATTPSGVAGLAEFSVINRAIGVLIEQGHPPGTARDELHRRAELAGHTLSVAAQHLLDQDPPEAS